MTGRRRSRSSPGSPRNGSTATVDEPAAGAPAAGKPVIVDTAAELADRCCRWLAEEALGVDTEFVRERTFYPGLGLIQISDRRGNVLVDPVAIEDLGALREVLRAPRVTKVFHSCGEDLEVFYHRFGCFPQPIFDTQVAAAFSGLGASLGYGKLVEELFGVELPKGQTRSNWLRRPLTFEQQRYAALDVAYLLPLYGRLRGDLERLGRRDWVTEEVERLADERRFLPDPAAVFRDLGDWKMSGRELAVLRAVAEWRERQARRRDLPRNFVVPVAALSEIARRQPRDRDALGQIRNLRDSDIRRHGAAILRMVDEAVELPAGALPGRRPRPLNLVPYRREVDRLRRAVARKASELGLPPELLATKKTVERLFREAVGGKPIAGQLSGWRREVLGEPLAEAMKGLLV